MSNQNEQVVPFFARYLEGQFCEDLSEEEMGEVQGGLKIPPKLKYPPKKGDEIVNTLKFPSDQEDGGHPPTYGTKKYPSDSDEHFQTRKYPSDGDDHIKYDYSS